MPEDHLTIKKTLEARFAGILFNPRDYSFYLAIHDYIDFVYTNPILSALLFEQRKVYYDLFRGIQIEWRRELDLCDHHNKKVVAKINDTYSRRVAIMEAMNLWSRFLGPKQIHFAIEEQRGIEQWKSDLEMPSTETQTEALQEIRHNTISRRNHFVEHAALADFRSVIALHYGLLDRLFVDVPDSEKAEAQQKLGDETAPGSSTVTVQSVTFDAATSILHLLGEKIQIAKQAKETNAHKILEYIFVTKKDPSEKYFYSEMDVEAFGGMLEKVSGPRTDKNYWRRYYAACQDINEKVRRGTSAKIEDFMVPTSGRTGVVKINPKYLPPRA